MSIDRNYIRGVRTHPEDVAQLQKLIRYVERWRLARFHHPEQRDDRRADDAEQLLRKLRLGLQMAGA